MGEGLERKRISVFFDDGARIVRHDGLCTKETIDSVWLDNKELIPKNRIIRVEVLQNGIS